MRFNVLTLFPEIPAAFFESSIMAKAVERGLITYNLVNIRDFAYDKHRTCDDLTYGGGAGMLLLPRNSHENQNSFLSAAATKGLINGSSTSTSMTKFRSATT